MPLIETRHLVKTYQADEVKTTAVRDISFSVAAGEFVAIMGPSGSGKSTLLHMLGFLDQPTSGQYLFDGIATETLSDLELAAIRNQKIGFVFQAFNLLPRTSVLENVILPLRYSRLARSERRARAMAALEKVEMAHRLNHSSNQLSGGERQRVAIARALVNDPKLILADEPTGNLDSRTGERVMDTIDQLHQQGHTIIVITHETPTARYAQRLLELKDGQLVKDEAVNRSQHPHYTK